MIHSYILTWVTVTVNITCTTVIIESSTSVCKASICLLCFCEHWRECCHIVLSLHLSLQRCWLVFVWHYNLTSMALSSWRRKPSTRSNAVFMHSIYTVYFWRMHLFGDYQVDRNLNSQVPSLTVKLFGVPLSSLRVLKSIKSVGTFQNKFTPVR